jgi:hypothetical protein
LRCGAWTARRPTTRAENEEAAARGRQHLLLVVVYTIVLSRKPRIIKAKEVPKRPGRLFPSLRGFFRAWPFPNRSPHRLLCSGHEDGRAVSADSLKAMLSVADALVVRDCKDVNMINRSNCVPSDLPIVQVGDLAAYDKMGKSISTKENNQDPMNQPLGDHYNICYSAGG